MVKMMQPATIKQAAEKARLQKLALEVIFRKHKVLPKSYPLVNQQPGGNARMANSGMNRRNLNPKVFTSPNPVKSPSMEQRRQLGLCYKCCEKFSPEDQCRW